MGSIPRLLFPSVQGSSEPRMLPATARTYWEPARRAGSTSYAIAEVGLADRGSAHIALFSYCPELCISQILGFTLTETLTASMSLERRTGGNDRPKLWIRSSAETLYLGFKKDSPGRLR